MWKRTRFHTDVKHMNRYVLCETVTYVCMNNISYRKLRVEILICIESENVYGVTYGQLRMYGQGWHRYWLILVLIERDRPCGPLLCRPSANYDHIKSWKFSNLVASILIPYNYFKCSPIRPWLAVTSNKQYPFFSIFFPSGLKLKLCNVGIK